MLLSYLKHQQHPLYMNWTEDQLKEKGIDIDAISKDEVFLDFIGRLKRFNFECSVALHLLEKKTLADMAEKAEVESKE